MRHCSSSSVEQCLRKSQHTVPVRMSCASRWGLSKHLHNKLGQPGSMLAHNGGQQVTAVEHQQLELGHQVGVFTHTAYL